MKIIQEKVDLFIDFYKNQDIEERRRIREAFLEKSRLSYPSWYAKMKRKVFNSLELSALSEICGHEFAK
jgi:hypothetical protein